ncbi:PHP domain-containing protein [Clostridium sp. Cult2]|uniref:PHP domain-containing protein n=1 Tax=Clostridium sp. Cult2 TaxID=2079003 RepID=UPI001F1A09DD|nr:PHP domain-containing protein [Clostridium sp. Cult2]MCF6466295.1 phosphatase [Clostridium sp. Cult2]
MIFDLHVHTTFSDGLFTPEEVVNLAIKTGIDGIAITDHDTILGIESAVQYSKEVGNITVIPGIELGCIYEDEEVHILGYFIDYKGENIKKTTKKLIENRVVRGIKMIGKINNLGMELSLHEVKALSKKDYIGRPHIARAMIKRGYISDVREGFDKFLNRGMPAYVEKDTLKLEEAMDLIHGSNGIAILAHPGILKNKDIIYHCIKKGIDGLEVIHSKHKEDDVAFLIEISKKYGLIMTGGSDCHGHKIDGNYLLGNYYININNIPIMKGRI